MSSAVPDAAAVRAPFPACTCPNARQLAGGTVRATLPWVLAPGELSP
ncbi:MAG: hypothetical protein Q8S16_04055 [Polaromonas sp.]|nr:hypothetical protein [Polaromonas sp.]